MSTFSYNSSKPGAIVYNGSQVTYLKMGDTLVWIRPNTCVFSSGSGGTYTYTIPVTGVYRLGGVGSGGGPEAANGHYSSGGSGGYFQVDVSLSKGTVITIGVGASVGASKQGTLSYITAAGTTYYGYGGGGGSSGGAKNFGDIMDIALGWQHGSGGGGAGGTHTGTGGNGNPGGTGTSNTISGGASVYNGYGAGGGYSNGNVVASGNGACWIWAIS